MLLLYGFMALLHCYLEDGHGPGGCACGDHPCRCLDGSSCAARICCFAEGKNVQQARRKRSRGTMYHIWVVIHGSPAKFFWPKSLVLKTAPGRVSFIAVLLPLTTSLFDISWQEKKCKKCLLQSIIPQSDTHEKRVEENCWYCLQGLWS